MISKTERAELRSIVKQQFRVLRTEVTQRQAELNAEARRLLNERETADDKARSNVDFLVNQSVLECNRKINDILREGGFEIRGDTEKMWVGAPQLWGRTYSGGGTDRQRLELQTTADIQEKVTQALTQIARQEADLLKELAVGALESDEARAFLAAIPSVSQLVPATRLAELEAQLAAPPDTQEDE